MSQEIIDAVREIERDKGIEEGALVAALEDALLAAYKKTPGASRHATVEMDDNGDFRVYSIELPADIEERLLDEAKDFRVAEFLDNKFASHIDLFDQYAPAAAGRHLIGVDVRHGLAGPHQASDAADIAVADGGSQGGHQSLERGDVPFAFGLGSH